MLAWSVRFALFAVARSAVPVLVAQALQGVCFFGMAAAMIVVERTVAPSARASAQSFLAWLTYGVGTFAGSMLGGLVPEQAHGDWTVVWAVPAAGCALVLVLFSAGLRVATTPEASLGR